MNKREKDTFITQRPAYMIVGEQIDSPNWNGYTLQINEVDKTASIINLEKGGKVTMLKQEVKALEGFEHIVEELYAQKAGIEEKKAEAMKIAMEKIDAEYAHKVELIDAMLEKSTEVIEVEVPDEEPVAEEVVAEEVAEESIAF